MDVNHAPYHRPVAPVSDAAGVNGRAAVNGASRSVDPADDLEAERGRLEAELAATRTRIAVAHRRVASRQAEVEAAMRRELAAAREAIAAMEQEHAAALAALRSSAGPAGAR
jgi:hypothetical protein